MTIPTPKCSFCSFEKKILGTIAEFNMVSKGDRVLCAVSGGRDSVALLTALCRLSGFLGIGVYAVHLNHSLRGEESDGDEQFVKELCLQMNVPLISEKQDIAKAAENSDDSLETVARAARYELYGRAADKLSCNKIATAHTADDNAETVLMNLTRGTGIDGLCGIPAVRGNIVRPMIAVTEKEVEAYLTSLGVSWRTDSSNLTDDYTRNKIRHKIVPLFRELNPSFDTGILRMSGVLRRDALLLEKFASLEAERAGIDTASGTASVSALSTFAETNENSGLIYRILSKMVGDRRLVTAERTAAVMKILNSPGKSGLIELSDKSSLCFNGISMRVLKNGARPSEKPVYLKKIAPGDTEIPEIDTVISAKIEKNSSFFEIIHTKNKIIRLNYDKIIGELFVREKRDGDRIVVGGIEKSLKKLFSDRKIRSCEAPFYPVLCDSEGIVAVCGLCVADRVRITGNTDVLVVGLEESPIFMKNDL